MSAQPDDRWIFAEAWPNTAIVQQAAAQFPGLQLCALLDKVKAPIDTHPAAGTKGAR